MNVMDRQTNDNRGRTRTMIYIVLDFEVIISDSRPAGFPVKSQASVLEPGLLPSKGPIPTAGLDVDKDMTHMTRTLDSTGASQPAMRWMSLACRLQHPMELGGAVEQESVRLRVGKRGGREEIEPLNAKPGEAISLSSGAGTKHHAGIGTRRQRDLCSIARPQFHSGLDA